MVSPASDASVPRGWFQGVTMGTWLGVVALRPVEVAMLFSSLTLVALLALGLLI